jgi:hypothetical protein
MSKKGTEAFHSSVPCFLIERISPKQGAGRLRRPHPVLGFFCFVIF